MAVSSVLAVGAVLLPALVLEPGAPGGGAIQREPPKALLVQEFRDLNAILRGLAPMAEPQRFASEPPPSIDLDVRFAVGSAALTQEAIRQIEVLAEALQSDALAGRQIMIAGHTDASGPSDKNLALSHRRANSVRDYLTAEHGINPGRLATVGFGEERLKDQLSPTSGINRRVEVRVLGELPWWRS